MTSSQETKITAAFSYIKNVGKHILFNFNYDLLGYKRLLDNPADFAWFTDIFHSYLRSYSVRVRGRKKKKIEKKIS